MTNVDKNSYPNYTSLLCETCDGLGFTMKEDLWKPEPCDCMSDAPKVVEPHRTD